MSETFPDFNVLMDGSKYVIEKARSDGSSDLIKQLDVYCRDLHLLACNCYGLQNLSARNYGEIRSRLQEARELFPDSYLARNNVIRESHVLRLMAESVRKLIC